MIALICPDSREVFVDESDAAAEIVGRRTGQGFPPDGEAALEEGDAAVQLGGAVAGGVSESAGESHGGGGDIVLEIAVGGSQGGEAVGNFHGAGGIGPGRLLGSEVEG